MKILLIEDSVDDIELAMRAFDKIGLKDQVEVARNGQEALQILFEKKLPTGESPVKLILLDLNLPVTPGLEVLRQIRRNPATRKTPVLVLTVSKTDPDLLQTFTMGATDYLIKPLEPVRFKQLYEKHAGENP